jgi:hypothetical protein
MALLYDGQISQPVTFVTAIHGKIRFLACGTYPAVPVLGSKTGEWAPRSNPTRALPLDADLWWERMALP